MGPEFHLLERHPIFKQHNTERRGSSSILRAKTTVFLERESDIHRYSLLGFRFFFRRRSLCFSLDLHLFLDERNCISGNEKFNIGVYLLLKCGVRNAKFVDL